MLFVTPYANARQLIAWVLGLGENARIVGPPELVDELRERVELLVDRHSGEPQVAEPVAARPRPPSPDAARPSRAAARRRRDSNGHRADAAIRPERFARLVTLASILIDAGRAGRLLDVAEVVQRAQGLRAGAARGHRGAQRRELRRRHLRALRRDPSPTARSRSTPSPTGTRSRARRGCCPVEAKALIAAIDLIGEHIPEGSLASVREKVVDAAGRGPRPRGTSIRGRRRGRRRDRRRRLARHRRPPDALVRVLQGERGRVLDPARRALRADQRPRGLVPGQLRSLARRASATSGWTGSSPRRSPTKRFEPRPDVDPAADVDGWPRTGEVPASSRARVWISPERARWAREERGSSPSCRTAR